MCGIFGVIGNKESNFELFPEYIRSLFLLSESRGKEASGFAALYDQKIRVYRTHTQAHELIKKQNFINAINASKSASGPVAFIGHSRIATNGSPYKDQNNQPVIGKETVMVHNGIIVNASALWTAHFPHTQQPQLDTAVISHVLDLLIQNHQGRVGVAFQTLFTNIQGEASIALLARNTQSIFLGTNTGSLYGALTNSGLYIFSSERYITQTALSNIQDTSDIDHLRPGQIMEIPFRTLRLSPIHIRAASEPAHYTIQKIVDTQSFIPTKDLYRNSIAALKHHVPDTEAIEAIPRCTKCIMPITMPLIQLDSDGVCNFCRTYTKQHPSGAQSLRKLIEPYRSKDGTADCIVALSGGRDSSYGLHYAKIVLGLNPMAYTYDWGMVTDVARRNQSRMVSQLGVEHIWVSADINRKRQNILKNVEAWLAKPDIAMVPLFMAGDKQAEYYVEELKKKTGIKLVIYCRGNQLEDERFKFGYFGIFDGTPKGVIHNLSISGKTAMAAYVAKACLNNSRYLNSSMTDSLFAFASSYLMPHNDFLYLWHYIPWDEHTIVSTIKNVYGWESASDTVSTWRIDDGTPPFYNYIYYKVQGFTEHDGLRSNQIREGHLSRKEALRLVTLENKPRYESLKDYFDLIGINGDHALSVVDHMPTRY